MRSTAILVFGAALGIGMTGFTRDARALGPVDLEIGAKVGGGGAPFSGQPNPLGFGVGGRAGVAFSGWYGGLSLMYYIGESGTVSAVTASEHSFLYGIEGGYGLKLLGLLTLRGLIGLGNFTVDLSGIPQPNVSNLYLEPGITALVSLGLWYFGADVNALILPGISDPTNPTSSSWATAVTAHGQAGVKF
ncbi:MAG TPA: hypothetical protein VN894_08785 [Polyangiaceae bacterium]|nr:hypothetical protein [Polyangiaceae bacterium]